MRKLLVIIVIFFFLIITACDNRSSQDAFGTPEETLNQAETDTKEQLEEVSYDKNGITAVYPKFISGGTKEEISNWNRIISSDFDQIVHIYSFNPIPGPTPSPSAEIPIILNIQYEIKLLNNYIISVFYKANYHTSFSAYPTELVYTTNIKKDDSKRLRLADVVELNQDFVKDFRTWNFIITEEENEEWNQAIRDYLNNISDEDLLMGFQAADQIGSKNIWGINSYYTKDKIGISLGVPNYIGDHVEFEQEYSKVERYLKPEVKLVP